MRLQILNVQRNGKLADSRPRIQIVGNWLAELGFIKGALVQALPEPGGFVFNLCNENVHYSELNNSTKEKGGTLIKVYYESRIKGETALTTKGNHITRFGLNFGDSLIAKCEKGCIRFRKVEGNIRLIKVAKEKNKIGESIPKIFLLGDWLAGTGFAPDTLVTIAAQPGCIIFTAQDKAIVYSDLVRFVRQNKMRLAQVATKNGLPLLNVGGWCARSAGFTLDDIYAATYEHGIIKLQKPDLAVLGF